MKILVNALIAVCLLMLPTGCAFWSVSSNLIEEISPIILLYFDQGSGGQLQESTIIPPLRKEKNRVITAEATLVKDGRTQLNDKYFREMKGGQLRTVIISKKVAQSDILPILNTLLLDPVISDRLTLAVMEGNFNDYVKKQIEEQQEPVDFFLYKMFAHYEKQGGITVTNLHDFMEAYYSPYSAPKVPLFRVKGDEFNYAGTAIFKKEKMIGEITSLDDMLFQMLSQKAKFYKTFPLPEQEIALGSLGLKRKIWIRSGEVHIQLGLKGRVEEYRGGRNLNRPEEVEQLTRQLESYLGRKVTRLVEKLQQWGVDPLEVGERTLGPFSQPYSGEEWSKAWPVMRVHTDVQLKLESVGLLQIKGGY